MLRNSSIENYINTSRLVIVTICQINQIKLKIRNLQFRISSYPAPDVSSTHFTYKRVGSQYQSLIYVGNPQYNQCAVGFSQDLHHFHLDYHRRGVEELHGSNEVWVVIKWA